MYGGVIEVCTARSAVKLMMPQYLLPHHLTSHFLLPSPPPSITPTRPFCPPSPRPHNHPDYSSPSVTTTLQAMSSFNNAIEFGLRKFY